MKAIFLVCAALAVLTDIAFAADMPVKAPIVTVTGRTSVDWTGFYIGGHVGWGSVDEKSTFVGAPGAVFITVPVGSVTNGDRDGFLGGFQGGFNWQLGRIVLGLSGDFSWTEAQTSVFTSSQLIAGAYNIQNAHNHWYASATGRIGYDWDSWLLYVKGGAAWDNAHYDGSVFLFGTTLVYPGFTNIRTGWTAGVGVERVLWNNWSWMIEYDHMDFGTMHGAYVPSTPDVTNFVDSRTHIDVIKLGLNYKLDLGSVAKFSR